LDYNQDGTLDANRSASMTAQSTLAPYPDLVAAAVSASATATLGQIVTVSWTDANQGTAAAPGTWTDGIYLLASPTDANPTLVGSTTISGTLAPGQSLAWTQHFTCPGTAGQYFIVVTTDADGGILEVPAPADNTTVSAMSIDVQPAPLPDLVVSSIVPPVSALSGTSVPITFVVTNQGNAPTSAPVWYDYAFISQDPNLTFAGSTSLVSDRPIHDVVVHEEGVLPVAAPNPSYLAPGQSYQQTIDVTVPLGADGTWYAYAVANGLGKHFAHQAAFVESNIGTTTTPET
jgi:hypothetical protein